MFGPAEGDAPDKDIRAFWKRGTAKARKEKTTRVPDWTDAWLNDPNGADVAVVWFDGMADNKSDNGIVSDEQTDKLGGAWALPGWMEGTKDGSALLVYVLAREGKVDQGRKVAADLRAHSQGDGGDYSVELAAPLELYPGTGWSWEARWEPHAASLPSLQEAPARVLLDRNHQPLDSHQPLALPTAVLLSIVNPPPVLFASLGSVAKEFSDSSALGVAGLEVSLTPVGDLPVGLPSEARKAHFKPSWRALPSGSDRATISWGLTNNTSSEFRDRVVLLAACPSDGQQNRFLFGTADLLACEAKGLASNCQAYTGGKLGALFNSRPDVRPLLPSNAGLSPCHPTLAVAQTDKVWTFEPSAHPWATSLTMRIDVPTECLEGELPESPSVEDLRVRLEALRRRCATPLLDAFTELLGQPVVQSFAKESLPMALSTGGTQEVNKLYAWRLLHRFSQTLAKRALARAQSWDPKCSAPGCSPEVELLRVVTAPSK